MNRWHLRLAYTLAGLALVAACAAPNLASLEERLTDPRLSKAPLPLGTQALAETLGVETRYFRTRSGLRLAYSILEPGDYGFRAQVQRRGETRFVFTAGPRERPQSPLGAALLLHGWGMDRSSLYPWALTLAEAGHRVLLVDLRSHGQSSDAPPGYGRREAEDLAELLAALDEQSQLPSPLHLLGVSYGAATAAHLSARLPGRFASVTLLEPFANAGDAIRDMVPALLDAPDARPWQQPARTLLKLRLNQARIEEAIAASSARLGVDLNRVDLAPVLRASHACTLLLHGALDRHVAVRHGQRLAAEVPSLQYRELPHEDHITLPLRVDWLGSPLVSWMRSVASLPASECPDLQLPPDEVPAVAKLRPGRLDLIEFAGANPTDRHVKASSARNLWRPN